MSMSMIENESMYIYIFGLFPFIIWLSDLQFIRTSQPMQHKRIQGCLIVVLLCGVLNLVMAQVDINVQHLQTVMGKQDGGVQKLQYKKGSQFKNQHRNQLTGWILQEIQHNQQYPEVLPYQSPTFMLNPHSPQIYRIPASLTQLIHIQISSYQISNQGLLILPQSPDESTFVQVQSFDSNPGQYHNEGRVYIQKTIPLRFSTKQKYLRFTNKGSRALVVMLDIEQSDMLMQIIVSDDKFGLTGKKMQTILQQTKQSEVVRQHIYKWQWGFYQKLWRHQSDMLGFTGAQLLVIVVTSIVQMYCIKNLINNELII